MKITNSQTLSECVCIEKSVMVEAQVSVFPITGTTNREDSQENGIV